MLIEYWKCLRAKDSFYNACINSAFGIILNNNIEINKKYFRLFERAKSIIDGGKPLTL